MSEPLGMIAGSGELPFRVAEAARAAGRSVVVVGFDDETDPALAQVVDELRLLPFGKLAALRDALRQMGARQAVMLGGIRKRQLFRDFVPDAALTGLMAKMRTLQDDHALRAIAGWLGEQGIAVGAVHELVPELLAQVGAWTRQQPTDAQWADIAVGREVVQLVGRADIGQTVVVNQRAVVAVEAVEGTDATIRRAGMLAGPGAVVVKAVKPGQDRRFDLPAVGPDTIAVMREVGAVVLAVGAGSSLVLGRPQLVAAADQADIAALGIELDERG